MKEVVPNVVRRRGSDPDNPKGGELDPAINDRRRYKKNSPSVLSCIGKRTKEGCALGIEVGTIHNGRGRQ